MAVKYLSGNRVTALSTDLVTETPQGYAGGNATSSTQSAGGGGAGGTATGSGNKNGGIGKVNPIVGSTHGESSGGSYYLAGGGGGAGEASGASTGGLGGGGNGGTIGTASTQATSGYGGGAGGAGNSGTNYPNGASGVVILKLLTSASFSSSNATSSTTGSYTILTYTSTSSSSFTISSGTADVQYLVVAGGGASKDNWGYAGGGGAGGFITGTKTALASGTYTVSVGAGGIGAGSSTTPANGGNSVFSNITALGGGGAGSWIVNSGTGFDGGSGGGAQGNSGGNDVGGSGATYSTPKLGTTPATPDHSDDFSSDNWVDQHTNNSVSSNVLNFNSIPNGSNTSTSLDLGSALSNTEWVMRYEFSPTSKNINYGTVNGYLFAGISNSASSTDMDTGQDFLGAIFGGGPTINSAEGFASLSAPDSAGEAKPQSALTPDDIALTWSTSTTYYVEMKRTSATAFSVELFSDSGYSTSLGKSDVTTNTSVTGLQYVKIGNLITTNSDHISGTIDNLKIYDGVTSVSTDNAVTVPNGSVAEETDTGKHKIWNSTTSAWVEIS